jgi:hypothetical protein
VRRALVIAAVGAAAVAAVLVWRFVLHGSAEPVSVGQAVSSYRGDSSGDGTGLPVATGVYVYATKGFEKIDALIGARHDYPSETVIAVEAGPCGLRLRWMALHQRSTDFSLCPGRERWTIERYDEVHAFFGRTERTSYRCDAGSIWWPVTAKAGTAWTRTCSTENTTEAARGTLVGIERLEIGGEHVGAVHLRLTTTLTGRTRGTGLFEIWLAQPSGLPVRLRIENDNRTSSAIGDVRYREQADLALVSLEPRR